MGQDPQIFLSSSGSLVRFAGEDLLDREEAKTGGAVPPEGPLIRRLSVMLTALLVSKTKIGPFLCGFLNSALAARLSPHLYMHGPGKWTLFPTTI